MNREEGARVLSTVRDNVADLHDALEKAMTALDSIADDEVPSFLETQAWAARDAYNIQLAQWRKVLEPQGADGALGGIEAGLRRMDSGSSTGSPSRKASLKERLAAMGATPALGNGMVLPTASSRQLSQLHVTASPAARECFLNKHGVELNSSPGLKTPASKQQSPPWMEELKKKKLGVSSTPIATSGLQHDLASELGSALARRSASLKSAASE